MRYTILAFLLFILVSCSKNDIDYPPIGNLSIDSIKVIGNDLPGQMFNDAFFLNEFTGYVVSNVGGIYKTVDGAKTWSELPSPVGFFLKKIQFMDADNGYITGGNESGAYLFKTTNKGDLWTKIKLSSSLTSWPSGMHFINKNLGFIVGQKSFLKTTDGGVNWTEIFPNNQNQFYDIKFKDQNEGIVTSDNGIYYKTINAGVTWTAVQSGINKSLREIYLTDDGKWFIKLESNELLDLQTQKLITIPKSASSFLLLNEVKGIGIGQHYETGFLPYGDIFVTNNKWITSDNKVYEPNEALNFTVATKVAAGKIMLFGQGRLQSTILIIKY